MNTQKLTAWIHWLSLVIYEEDKESADGHWIFWLPLILWSEQLQDAPIGPPLVVFNLLGCRTRCPLWGLLLAIR